MDGPASLDPGGDRVVEGSGHPFEAQHLVV
jgi:hypothetical protein